MNDQLVPNRDCGGCTVCCKELTINEPELKKLPGILCDHCTSGGCGIYETRPSMCQTWHCGWRMLPQLDDTWRPDRSQILVTLSYGGIPEKYQQQSGLEFTLVGDLQQVRWDPFVIYIAGLVDAGIPVFLAVRGKPGHASGKIFLNDRLAAAIASADFVKVADQMTLAMQACVNHPKEKVELD